MKIVSIIGLVFLLLMSANAPGLPKGGWEAGVGRAGITPEEPVWMGGFGFRDRPAEAKEQDLWAKALALKDAKGKTVVMITVDVVKIPKNVSDTIRGILHSRFGLTKAEILINCSHTHSGPALEDVNGIPFSDEMQSPEQTARIARYTSRFVGEVLAAAGNAINSMKPATVYADNGVTRFQVNRRNNPIENLNRQTQLNGPIEHSVPVLKVVGADKALKAIVFGYACHPTILRGYLWSGDFPGYAQQRLEELYPTATAMFCQGAGGDVSALPPKRTREYAEQYGRELAGAVQQVVDGEMPLLDPEVTAVYAEIPLPYKRIPSPEELLKTAESGAGYEKRWARRLLDILERGQQLDSSYPYPIQFWKLGSQQMIALGGELTIEYAIKLKQMLGENLFVFGYSNDLMGYIPSLTVLSEGGYEGYSAQYYHTHPGPWAPSIETIILKESLRLAEGAGLH
ncbi:MAG: hypothetical protein ABS46_01885 [Cytophagaceae bacterium SCN 52-12]|nr:MAG: hypothetical protein ABS46_01885 [Cytophagaceae bacterium SCN 52-12]